MPDFLKEPLSHDEVEKQFAATGRVHGTVLVVLHDIVVHDEEDVKTLIAEKLVGDAGELLKDVAYKAVGVHEGDLIIDVSGDPCIIIG